MFGASNTKSWGDTKRHGKNELAFPSMGKLVAFELIRAGDFFMVDGKLYLKTNLTESVEVPQGTEPIIGTSNFTGDPCHVVNVRIQILE